MSRLLRLSCRNQGVFLRTITRSTARLSYTSSITQTPTDLKLPKILSTCQSSISSQGQRRSIQHQALRARTSTALADRISDITAETTKYKIQEHPLGQLRPLKVVIFGAGVNGLNMLYTLQKEAKDLEYVIYEKSPECGGTWFENR